jgi:pyruvate kinase
MAKTISAFRPKLPVFAFSFWTQSLCFLNILFGIIAMKIEKKSNIENVENWIKKLISRNLVSSWDRLVVIYDRKVGEKFVPSIEIREI